MLNVIIFFFSSRRRHTRFSRDWSSDVCSSDLIPWLALWRGEPERRSTSTGPADAAERSGGLLRSRLAWAVAGYFGSQSMIAYIRSEERRVGKEWRFRWSP